MEPPDAFFGDRTDRRQSGASSNYDTYDSQFSSGGGMHSTVNDYGMSAAISQNGGNYDISISYRYKGSGTAASNMKLYAALVDKDRTGYSYSSGIPHGYNCWMAWLTAGDTLQIQKLRNGLCLPQRDRVLHPDNAIMDIRATLWFPVVSTKPSWSPP